MLFDVKLQIPASKIRMFPFPIANACQTLELEYHTTIE